MENKNVCYELAIFLHQLLLQLLNERQRSVELEAGNTSAGVPRSCFAPSVDLFPFPPFRSLILCSFLFAFLLHLRKSCLPFRAKSGLLVLLSRVGPEDVQKGFTVSCGSPDHSCPQSSLVSPKRVVWCMGGNRYSWIMLDT